MTKTHLAELRKLASAVADSLKAGLEVCFDDAEPHLASQGSRLINPGDNPEHKQAKAAVLSASRQFEQWKESIRASLPKPHSAITPDDSAQKNSDRIDAACAQIIDANRIILNRLNRDPEEKQDRERDFAQLHLTLERGLWWITAILGEKPNGPDGMGRFWWNNQPHEFRSVREERLVTYLWSHTRVRLDVLIDYVWDEPNTIDALKSLQYRVNVWLTDDLDAKLAIRRDSGWVRLER